MPDISRIPVRMDCQGIDLTAPIDKMPKGSFPYLFNGRVLVDGGIDGRPGYTRLASLAGRPNSIRRLNDPTGVYAPGRFIYVGGVGDKLYAGQPSGYTLVDSGYSGKPLSLITFRPDQSPESWMYIYDALKLEKLRPDSTVRPIGVSPPSYPPAAEYGIPAEAEITQAQTAAGWGVTGASTSAVTGTRSEASCVINAILYNVGSTGWCCIAPAIVFGDWMGDRMRILLNGTETVTVRSVLKAIHNTTILAIAYDSPINTGLCSLLLADSPEGLDRNSLIQLGSEVVRVLEVNKSPTGTGYSVRCSTVGTHVAGEAVTGMVSFYTYTNDTHAVGEAILAHYVSVTQGAGGTGSATKAVSVNASLANGRAIDPANDYMHISLFLDNPANTNTVRILVSLDGAPNYSFSNPGNSYIWTLSGTELKLMGAAASGWLEVVVPISQAVRSGGDYTRTFADISGVAVEMTSTGASNYGLDWFYLFGTYGQVILPNSPVGTVYSYRNRDFFTGAKSLPGPQTRYQLFPLREAVIITPAYSPLAEVTVFDVYRQGGSVTSPLYVSSIQNSTPAQSYTDGLSDDSVLAANQPPDLTAIQPWPILQSVRSGDVTIIGTSVFLTGGTPFDLNMVANTLIVINDVTYLTYGQPRSTTFLEIQQDAGYIATGNYQINSPVFAAQALPYAFGPLEGPFAPVIFALGDPLNGGLLYYSNFNDADSASDANTVELAPPSNSLVSGQVWNGLCFAGNRDDIFCIRYTYLQAINAGGSNAYQWAKVPALSGFWSRWATCSSPIGVAYLGRDGIYVVTDQGAVNISDEKLYPLFPHEGQPAKTIIVGEDIILPVDMEQTDFLRMSASTEEIRFAYKDIDGNFNTLVYEIGKKRWFLYNFADGINIHYLDELAEESANQQRQIMLSVNTNKMLLAGGDTDDGTAINTIVLTPSFDGGDERAQKLYVDTMVQVLWQSTLYPLNYIATYDNAQSFSPVVPVAAEVGVQQYLQNIASLADLSLHRNVGAKFAWTGGPSGLRLIAWEASGYLQPYLSNSIVTQVNPFSFPGWKHMRRMFPAYISNEPITFKIMCQDGRIFGPYTLPSSLGKYRIFPMMMDRNIKDLAFALSLVSNSGTSNFALFPQDFTIEVKEWTEATYIKLAVFRA